MSILFLFGAGASTGLYCTPRPPPLSRDLFVELQKAGGIASTIRGELADSFRHDFEAGMDRFFHEHNEDVIRFLRDMAQYFARFQPGPNNEYIKLIESLVRLNDEVIFSTTNYELLIEKAAKHVGLDVDYNYRPLRKNHLSVLKLHGSINFLPVIEGRLQKQFEGNIPDRSSV